MSTSLFLILLAIGLVAGTISGLIGVGGAIIIIPALLYLIGMDQYQAQGTSLAIMLPPIGLLAAYNYFKAGELNLKYAMIIAVAFFVGGYFGSKLALMIPVDNLRKIFGFVLLVIAIHIIFSK
ncbi:MAG: sulfite exporter TauE/SafE family protein [Bacteroidales bacterium]|nr:sulfite exporter TauE/SafE family protein [Bacteroidales bacterium]